MEFIRFGNLKPQHHHVKNITEDDRSFHTPPMEWGIYAFPAGQIERFLLSGIGKGNLCNGRYSYLRDKNGNKIFMTFNEFYENVYDGILNEDIRIRAAELKISPKNICLYKLDNRGVVDGYISDEDEKLPVVFERKPVKFKYNGLIWHHLGERIKHCEIEATVGSWVLTTMNIYKKALEKEIRFMKSDNGKWSKDHMEVFIENIQK